jgi:hypothetical protein
MASGGIGGVGEAGVEEAAAGGAGTGGTGTGGAGGDGTGGGGAGTASGGETAPAGGALRAVSGLGGPTVVSGEGFGADGAVLLPPWNTKATSPGGVSSERGGRGGAGDRNIRATIAA